MCVWRGGAWWLSECAAVPVSVILNASPRKPHSAYSLSSTSHSSSLLNVLGCPGYSGFNGTGSTMVAISAFTYYVPGLHYNRCVQPVPLCSCTVQRRGHTVSKKNLHSPSSPPPPPSTGCRIIGAILDEWKQKWRFKKGMFFWTVKHRLPFQGFPHQIFQLSYF